MIWKTNVGYKNVGYKAWGPPRIKVWGGGGKGSWTERQIGMVLSYFVLIKLSVIKCLFNYDHAMMQLLSYIKSK